MRGFVILIIFCLLVPAYPANAALNLFQKKDYKQNFINDALNAEKRNDNKSAFHSYEKALFYYKKDSKVIEEYATFCERQKYFDKAQNLYEKLYTLTKNNHYLFKSSLCAIKNGKQTDEQIEKIFSSKVFTKNQKKELNAALIYHYSYKNDWQKVKKTCDKTPIEVIDKETITTCIVSMERMGHKKDGFKYYLRFSELYPKDSAVLNKIIKLAQENNNYEIQEKAIKKLSILNPSDIGIKYQLAGFYEKNGQWKNAAKIYEGLIASGDSSAHVKNSLAYVKKQLYPKKQSSAASDKPEPLSGYKLDEKLFYNNLDAKNYSKANIYLSKMLKKEPKNTKLLKHKMDIAVAQKNYKEAIKTFEKLEKLTSLSINDKKTLAFLYSKNEQSDKSLEIVETILAKTPENEDLLTLALQYSMESKNWKKAISYNNKLLKIKPDSESRLKLAGDLYSMEENFTEAVKIYEKLVSIYPKPQYKFALANLYMANQDFSNAENILKDLYEINPKNPLLVEPYLNSLLAQNKSRQAYWVIKTNHLEKTKAGYMVAGDIAMTDKNYDTAAKNYAKALDFEPESLILQNKLANSYRMSGYLNDSNELFKKVLQKDPKNIEARLGIGSLEIDRKNYDNAREIFNDILSENPDYRPAKIAIAHSYIAADEKLSGLRQINLISEDDETKLLKAQTYYDMNMWSDSKQILKGVATKDAEALRYKIRRDEAITITPSYSFFFQQLADAFNLDYHKFGMNVSKKTDNNMDVFMEYNVIVYSSGASYYYNNVVNEFRSGVKSRPSEKWEYRADIGVKAFQFGGAMLNTDSWIKHYFSDKFDLKLGFKRDNIEQSYISAVGSTIDGIFTGRSAYNKVYIEANGKLPYQIYMYGIGAYGVVYSANMLTNQYFEALLGIGKLLYNNPRNPWVNTFAFDIVSYNMGYQYNELKIYGRDGTLFGGYFSPSYFNATTANLKLEGKIKKWNLKWGIKGFGGIQTAISPDQTTPTWGFSPYITYDLNDNVSFNAVYSHFTYADLVRDQFMINAVIRGFRKNAKK